MSNKSSESVGDVQHETAREKDQPQQETEKQKKYNKHQPILIEQVSEIPAYDDTFYDVSFLHNGSKIYYFKRVYLNETKPHPDP